jgi:ABC-type branched-subunit amino acid transport system substrate-binding protein
MVYLTVTTVLSKIMTIVNKLFVLLISAIILTSCSGPWANLKNNRSEPAQKQFDLAKPNTPAVPAAPIFPGVSPPKIINKKIQIAALLPLSGKNKELGQSLLNSAVVALFENDKNNDLELVIYDVSDSKSDAQKAVKDAAKKNIKIIIGPVFSSSLEEISGTIKSNNMTALSFSNNMDLTNKKGIFLMGLFPEQQIEKAVSYAITTGRDSFSIIAPNNAYGIKVSDILKETVKRKDGNFITSELYLTNPRDLEKIAQRVVNAYIVPARLYEDKGNRKAVASAISDHDKIYSKVIFIPESGKMLSRFVAAIKKYNVSEREFQIIGTNQWDNQEVLNDDNLIGAWFPSPDPALYREFERKYYQLYGKFPMRIDSLAYDAIFAICEVINKSKKRELRPEDFVNYDGPKNGFAGIDGLFRFLPNGIVQRNLAMLQIGNGKFEVVDSPSSVFLRY